MSADAGMPRTDAIAEKWKHRILPEPEVGELYELCTELETALTAAQAENERLREQIAVIYDGNAVYAEMDVRAHARTSAENVSDVLDSVNRIWRQNAARSAK